jgi:predicted 3-demethylubiquinone-9 3-methyltransferase (glyoxalase superfamily)
MTTIAPFLMFVGDRCGQAEAAMALYVSAFDDAEILALEHHGEDEDESGVRQGRLRIAGQELRAMDSGHPHAFTFTPAVSLFVTCDTEAEVERAFAALAEGGAILMPLQAYDFSPRFGWVQDRFGVSWQLSVAAAPA